MHPGIRAETGDNERRRRGQRMDPRGHRCHPCHLSALLSLALILCLRAPLFRVSATDVVQILSLLQQVHVHHVLVILTLFSGGNLAGWREDHCTVDWQGDTHTKNDTDTDTGTNKGTGHSSTDTGKDKDTHNNVRARSTHTSRQQRKRSNILLPT